MYDVGSLKLMTFRFTLCNRAWSGIYPAMFFSLCPPYLPIFSSITRVAQTYHRIRLKSSKMYWNLWKSVKQNNTKKYDETNGDLIGLNFETWHLNMIWVQHFVRNWFHCDCLLNFLGDNNLRFHNIWKILNSVLISYGSDIRNYESDLLHTLLYLLLTLQKPNQRRANKLLA